MLCRSKAGVSQRALGAAVGLTNASIAMLERGKRSPSFEVFLALADYFNVSLDYLCGRSDDPAFSPAAGRRPDGRKGT